MRDGRVIARGEPGDTLTIGAYSVVREAFHEGVLPAFARSTGTSCSGFVVVIPGGMAISRSRSGWAKRTTRPRKPFMKMSMLIGLMTLGASVAGLG